MSKLRLVSVLSIAIMAISLTSCNLIGGNYDLSAPRVDAIISYSAYGEKFSQRFAEGRRVLVPTGASDIQVIAIAEDSETGITEARFSEYPEKFTPSSYAEADRNSALYRARITGTMEKLFDGEIQRFDVVARNAHNISVSRTFELATIDETFPGALGCPPVKYAGQKLKVRRVSRKSDVKQFFYFKMLDTGPCTEEFVEVTRNDTTFAIGSYESDPGRVIFVGNVKDRNLSKTRYADDPDAEYWYYNFSIGDDHSPVVIASTIRSVDRQRWILSVPMKRLYHPRHFGIEPVEVHYRMEVAMSGVDDNTGIDNDYGWRLEDVSITLCGEKEC